MNHLDIETGDCEVPLDETCSQSMAMLDCVDCYHAREADCGVPMTSSPIEDASQYTNTLSFKNL